MTKYTAADFANAQFAEHPAGGLGHRTDFNKWRLSDSTMTHTSSSLVLDGWIPVHPAKTITDSDVEDLCDPYLYNNDAYLDGFIQGFQAAGGTILDDPTNLDRLKQLHEAWIEDHGAMSNMSLVEYLDQHGVRVEEGK